MSANPSLSSLLAAVERREKADQLVEVARQADIGSSSSCISSGDWHSPACVAFDEAIREAGEASLAVKGIDLSALRALAHQHAEALRRQAHLIETQESGLASDPERDAADFIEGER